MEIIPQHSFGWIDFLKRIFSFPMLLEEEKSIFAPALKIEDKVIIVSHVGAVSEPISEINGRKDAIISRSKLYKSTIGFILSFLVYRFRFLLLSIFSFGVASATFREISGRKDTIISRSKR